MLLTEHLQAKQALRKAELALRPPATSARSSPGQNISALLSPHVLGIIAGINDQLQFSKRTVESKRAIIRSIGGFAREMGSLISLAAPQVGASRDTRSVALTASLDHDNTADYARKPGFHGRDSAQLARVPGYVGRP